MLRTARTSLEKTLAVVAASLICTTLAACGGGGSGGAGNPVDPPAQPACESGEAFDSTFAAIQKVVFERQGCTQQVCHGSGASGNLDLSPEVAYRNLLEVTSLGSPLKRVSPGDNDRSYLWLKLAASTLPGTVDIGGAPMPLGLPPLSENELEAVRLWIYAGAPETGTVIGTEGLLDACLPEPKPITIKPLDPPPAGQGVQLVMPQWNLQADSEHEVCVADHARSPSGRDPPPWWRRG